MVTFTSRPALYSLPPDFTTAITLETSQGDFAVAFALGIVLLMLVLLVNTFIIQMAGIRRETL